MKQKYSIIKDSENKKLTIKEYSETDNEIFSLVCEEVYDQEKIEAAIELGTDDLISAIRSHNMYPIKTYAEKLAEAIIELYKSDNNQSVDIFLDDKDFLNVIENDDDDLEAIADEVILNVDAAPQTNELDSLLDDKIELKVADDTEGPVETIND